MQNKLLSRLLITCIILGSICIATEYSQPVEKTNNNSTKSVEEIQDKETD